MKRIAGVLSLALVATPSLATAEELPNRPRELMELSNQCRLHFKAVQHFGLLPNAADELQKADKALEVVIVRESRDGLGQSREETEKQIRALAIAYWKQFATSERTFEASPEDRKRIAAEAQRCLEKVKEVGERSFSLARYRLVSTCRAAAAPLQKKLEADPNASSKAGIDPEMVATLDRYSARALEEETKKLGYSRSRVDERVERERRRIWKEIEEAGLTSQSFGAHLEPVLSRCLQSAQFEAAIQQVSN